MLKETSTIGQLRREIGERMEAKIVDQVERRDDIPIAAMSDECRERKMEAALTLLMEVWGADVYASAQGSRTSAASVGRLYDAE